MRPDRPEETGDISGVPQDAVRGHQCAEGVVCRGVRLSKTSCSWKKKIDIMSHVH